MPSPWPRVKLAEVTVNHDGRRIPVREADRKPGPYPYYGASGVVDHVDRYLFEGLHLLIAEDGENLRTRQTPVAFLADGQFWVNNHAHIVTGNERADTRFLCYALAVTEIGGYLTGSAMPKLTQRAMNAIEVPLPPIDTQRAIAETLSSLDDKIEQNRRTGAKLEGFKAWFVDFEPVKAKAAGATAFPGMPPETFAALPTRLTDYPLGPVPQGWEVKTAGELASFILGGDWGKDTPTEETPDPAHCIRGADIPDLWANGLGKMPVRYLKRGSLQKRSLRAGDIAVEISGGSPTQSTGRPVLVTDALLAELPHPLVCSNFCRIFRPKQHHTNFTYFLFRWMYDAEQFLQYENGTTGIKNFAFTKFCEVHQVVMPHGSLLASFDVWIEPLMRAMAHAGSESRRLATLRDYLLPRLLSGRVRVTGVDDRLPAETAS